MGDHVACQTDLLIGDATMTMMHSFLPAGCGKVVFYITPSGRVFATFPTLSSSCTLPLTFAFLRHASNPLDSFVLVQGQHCQAESPTFDACLKKTLSWGPSPVSRPFFPSQSCSITSLRISWDHL